MRVSGKNSGKRVRFVRARVDFRFREVGVDRERRHEVRAEALRDVEADVACAVDRVARGRIDAATARHRRPHRKTATLRQRRQIGDEAGAARLRQLPVAPRACPSIGFLQPLDAPLDVEVPAGQILLEAEASASESRFRPTIPFASRCVAAIQMPSQLLFSLSPPGLISASYRAPPRIDLEHVARSAVEKRVEDDLDVVLVAQRAVALLREADDVVGFGVLADDADEDFGRPRPARERSSPRLAARPRSARSS